MADWIITYRIAVITEASELKPIVAGLVCYSCCIGNCRAGNVAGNLNGMQSDTRAGERLLLGVFYLVMRGFCKVGL